MVLPKPGLEKKSVGTWLRLVTSIAVTTLSLSSVQTLSFNVSKVLSFLLIVSILVSISYGWYTNTVLIRKIDAETKEVVATSSHAYLWGSNPRLNMLGDKILEVIAEKMN